jgi:hypothetical protein
MFLLSSFLPSLKNSLGCPRVASSYANRVVPYHPEFLASVPIEAINKEYFYLVGSVVVLIKEY